MDWLEKLVFIVTYLMALTVVFITGYDIGRKKRG